MGKKFPFQTRPKDQHSPDQMPPDFKGGQDAWDDQWWEQSVNNYLRTQAELKAAAEQAPQGNLLDTIATFGLSKIKAPAVGTPMPAKLKRISTGGRGYNIKNYVVGHTVQPVTIKDTSQPILQRLIKPITHSKPARQLLQYLQPVSDTMDAVKSNKIYKAASFAKDVFEGAKPHLAKLGKHSDTAAKLGNLKTNIPQYGFDYNPLDIAGGAAQNETDARVRQQLINMPKKEREEAAKELKNYPDETVQKEFLEAPKKFAEKKQTERKEAEEKARLEAERIAKEKKDIEESKEELYQDLQKKKFFGLKNTPESAAAKEYVMYRGYGYKMPLYKAFKVMDKKERQEVIERIVTAPEKLSPELKKLMTGEREDRTKTPPATRKHSPPKGEYKNKRLQYYRAPTPPPADVKMKSSFSRKNAPWDEKITESKFARPVIKIGGGIYKGTQDIAHGNIKEAIKDFGGAGAEAYDTFVHPHVKGTTADKYISKVTSKIPRAAAEIKFEHEFESGAGKIRREQREQNAKDLAFNQIQKYADEKMGGITAAKFINKLDPDKYIANEKKVLEDEKIKQRDIEIKKENERIEKEKRELENRIKIETELQQKREIPDEKPEEKTNWAEPYEKKNKELNADIANLKKSYNDINLELKNLKLEVGMSVEKQNEILARRRVLETQKKQFTPAFNKLQKEIEKNNDAMHAARFKAGTKEAVTFVKTVKKGVEETGKLISNYHNLRMAQLQGDNSPETEKKFREAEKELKGIGYDFANEVSFGGSEKFLHWSGTETGLEEWIEAHPEMHQNIVIGSMVVNPAGKVVGRVVRVAGKLQVEMKQGLRTASEISKTIRNIEIPTKEKGIFRKAFDQFTSAQKSKMSSAGGHLEGAKIEQKILKENLEYELHENEQSLKFINKNIESLTPSTGKLKPVYEKQKNLLANLDVKEATSHGKNPKVIFGDDDLKIGAKTKFRTQQASDLKTTMEEFATDRYNEKNLELIDMKKRLRRMVKNDGRTWAEIEKKNSPETVASLKREVQTKEALAQFTEQRKFLTEHIKETEKAIKKLHRRGMKTKLRPTGKQTFKEPKTHLAKLETEKENEAPKLKIIEHEKELKEEELKPEENKEKNKLKLPNINLSDSASDSSDRDWDYSSAPSDEKTSSEEEEKIKKEKSTKPYHGKGIAQDEKGEGEQEGAGKETGEAGAQSIATSAAQSGQINVDYFLNAMDTVKQKFLAQHNLNANSPIMRQIEQQLQRNPEDLINILDTATGVPVPIGLNMPQYAWDRELEEFEKRREELLEQIKNIPAGAERTKAAKIANKEIQDWYKAHKISTAGKETEEAQADPARMAIYQRRKEKKQKQREEKIKLEKQQEQERIEQEKQQEQERIEQEKQQEQERIEQEKQQEQERIEQEKQQEKLAIEKKKIEIEKKWDDKIAQRKNADAEWLEQQQIKKEQEKEEAIKKIKLETERKEWETKTAELDKKREEENEKLKKEYIAQGEAEFAKQEKEWTKFVPAENAPKIKSKITQRGRRPVRQTAPKYLPPLYEPEQEESVDIYDNPPAEELTQTNADLTPLDATRIEDYIQQSPEIITKKEQAENPELSNLETEQNPVTEQKQSGYMPNFEMAPAATPWKRKDMQMPIEITAEPNFDDEAKQENYNQELPQILSQQNLAQNYNLEPQLSADFALPAPEIPAPKLAQMEPLEDEYEQATGDTELLPNIDDLIAYIDDSISDVDLPQRAEQEPQLMDINAAPVEQAEEAEPQEEPAPEFENARPMEQGKIVLAPMPFNWQGTREEWDWRARNYIYQRTELADLIYHAQTDRTTNPDGTEGELVISPEQLQELENEDAELRRDFKQRWLFDDKKFGYRDSADSFDEWERVVTDNYQNIMYAQQNKEKQDELNALLGEPETGIGDTEGAGLAEGEAGLHSEPIFDEIQAIKKAMDFSQHATPVPSEDEDFEEEEEAIPVSYKTPYKPTGNRWLDEWEEKNKDWIPPEKHAEKNEETKLNPLTEFAVNYFNKKTEIPEEKTEEWWKPKMPAPKFNPFEGLSDEEEPLGELTSANIDEYKIFQEAQDALNNINFLPAVKTPAPRFIPYEDLSDEEPLETLTDINPDIAYHQAMDALDSINFSPPPPEDVPEDLLNFGLENKEPFKFNFPLDQQSFEHALEYIPPQLHKKFMGDYERWVTNPINRKRWYLQKDDIFLPQEGERKSEKITDEIKKMSQAGKEAWEYGEQKQKPENKFGFQNAPPAKTGSGGTGGKGEYKADIQLTPVYLNQDPIQDQYLPRFDYTDEDAVPLIAGEAEPTTGTEPAVLPPRNPLPEISVFEQQQRYRQAQEARQTFEEQEGTGVKSSAQQEIIKDYSQGEWTPPKIQEQFDREFPASAQLRWENETQKRMDEAAEIPLPREYDFEDRNSPARNFRLIANAPSGGDNSAQKAAQEELEKKRAEHYGLDTIPLQSSTGDRGSKDHQLAPISAQQLTDYQQNFWASANPTVEALTLRPIVRATPEEFNNPAQLEIDFTQQLKKANEIQEKNWIRGRKFNNAEFAEDYDYSTNLPLTPYTINQQGYMIPLAEQEDEPQEMYTKTPEGRMFWGVPENVIKREGTDSSGLPYNPDMYVINNPDIPDVRTPAQIKAGEGKERVVDMSGGFAQSRQTDGFATQKQQNDIQYNNPFEEDNMAVTTKKVGFERAKEKLNAPAPPVPPVPSRATGGTGWGDYTAETPASASMAQQQLQPNAYSNAASGIGGIMGNIASGLGSAVPVLGTIGQISGAVSGLISTGKGIYDMVTGADEKRRKQEAAEAEALYQQRRQESEQDRRKMQAEETADQQRRAEAQQYSLSTERGSVDWVTMPDGTRQQVSNLSEQGKKQLEAAGGMIDKLGDANQYAQDASDAIMSEYDRRNGENDQEAMRKVKDELARRGVSMDSPAYRAAMKREQDRQDEARQNAFDRAVNQGYSVGSDQYKNALAGFNTLNDVKSPLDQYKEMAGANAYSQSAVLPAWQYGAGRQDAANQYDLQGRQIQQNMYNYDAGQEQNQRNLERTLAQQSAQQFNQNQYDLQGKQAQREYDYNRDIYNNVENDRRAERDYYYDTKDRDNAYQRQQTAANQQHINAQLLAQQQHEYTRADMYNEREYQKKLSTEERAYYQPLGRWGNVLGGFVPSASTVQTAFNIYNDQQDRKEAANRRNAGK